MSAASRAEWPPFGNAREGAGIDGYCLRSGKSFGFPQHDVLDESIQWMIGTGSTGQSKTGFSSAYLAPLYSPKAGSPESILRWLEQYPAAPTRQQRRLTDVTVWCDLGEVILFVIDKRSLAKVTRTQQRLLELGAVRRKPTVYTAAGETELPSKHQEPDQAVESRIFGHLWLENTEAITGTVEDGGQMDPVGLFSREDEADKMGD
jgi:hypothetical protein